MRYNIYLIMAIFLFQLLLAGIILNSGIKTVKEYKKCTENLLEY